MNAILFQSANVLDVASLQLKTGQDVWVENGMIKSVGPHQADVFIASGTKVIKAEGKTLMPGMIDCHVHVIAAHLNLNITANQPNVFATLRALPIMKGANQIKIMASGGVASPNDPIHYLGYSEAEIRAIVEEAEHTGTYVMAHAYTPKAIHRAVAFGVRSIEHGNLIDEATANFMAEKNAYMVPTLITYEALANEGESLGLPAVSVAKIETVRSQGQKALELLAKVGVKMALGSDLLGESHRHQSEELRIRANILGNGAALQQATLNAAELINMSGQLGVVKAGAIADLLLVNGNPLNDISCLLGQGDHIEVIVKDGKIYKQA